MKLSAHQAFQQGVTAHKKGKLQDAERLYRAVLKLQPAHPDANYNLGLLALSLNKSQAALTLFKNALKANPSTERFWLSYIYALMKENEFNTARQALEQAKTRGIDQDRLDTLADQLITENQKPNAANLPPSRELIDSLLGYYRNGKLSDAKRLSREIIQFFPSHQFVWKLRGAVLFQLGEVHESIKAKKKVVQLAPKDSTAWSNLGNSLSQADRLDEAEASLRRSVALDPKTAVAHFNLGITLQKISRFEEAEISLQKSIKLNPEDPDLHYSLGNTLLALNKLAVAAASYIKAIDLKNDHTASLENLITTLTKLQSQTTKEDILKTAIVIAPGSIVYYAKLVRNLGFEKNLHSTRHLQKILRFLSCNLNFEKNHFLHKYLTERNIEKYQEVKSNIWSQDRFPNEDFLIFEKLNISSMRILNIGALHGATSFYMNHLGASEIFSVEPNNLYWNTLSQLEIKNHKILPFALSNRSGKAILYSPLAFRGRSSLVHIPHDQHNRFEVNLRTIDELNLGYFDFWKIDVEGSELDVLKGGMNTLKTNCPEFLQVEFWENDFDEIRELLSPFFKFMFACIVDAEFRLIFMPYQNAPSAWRTLDTKIVLFSKNEKS